MPSMHSTVSFLFPIRLGMFMERPPFGGNERFLIFHFLSFFLFPACERPLRVQDSRDYI